MSYHKILAQEFERRKLKNRRYSLRQFATQLGIGVSVLSPVMKGERQLQKKNILQLAKALKWSDQYTAEVLAESTKWKVESQKSLISHRDPPLPEKYHFLLEKHHLWCYNLAKLPQNQASTEWIAQEMGVSEPYAKSILESLVAEGFVRIHNNKLVPTEKRIVFIESPGSEAFLNFKKDVFGEGLHAIGSLPDEEQLSYVTHLALDKKDLVKLGHKVFSSIDRLKDISRRSKDKNLYYLTLQVFPCNTDKKA